MTNENERLDGEINIRVLARLTVGLMVLVAVAMVLMWFLASSMFQNEKSQDPPPPLMVEARVRHEPPSPRLQSHPFADLDNLRAEEAARLGSYGWVDESAGVAHIPIDRAKDLLIRHGLPETPIAVLSEEQPGD